MFVHIKGNIVWFHKRFKNACFYIKSDIKEINSFQVGLDFYSEAILANIFMVEFRK